MKWLLLLFSLPIWIGASSQQFGTLGSLKEKRFPFAFRGHKPNCLPDYSDAVMVENITVFVVGDSICGMFRYYLALVNDEPRLIEKSYFEDTTQIDTDLIRIKKTTPALNDRVKKGKEIFSDYKKDLEKQVKDTLEVLEKKIDKIMSSWAAKNWVLWDWSWSYPSEYSSMPEITVEIINPYKKKIKYAWFTFKAFNPVDDVVPSLRGNPTGKGIGPVEYGDRASWTFENIYYSKVIETIKVVQIKLQFFDGAVKTITNPVVLKKDDD